MKSRKVKAAEKWSRIKKKKQEEEDDSREPSPDLNALCNDISEESDGDNDVPMADETSEEEVLAISGESSESEEERNEQDGLPNRDAWGRKKSVYFNADFVDEDRGKTYREEDAELAKAEAEEALAIQRSVMSFVNASSLDRSLLLKEVSDPVEDADEIEKDNSTSLTKQEKLRKLKKTSPEFFTYSKEFKNKMLEISEKLEPCLKEIGSGKIPPGRLADYLREKYYITNQYCLNIISYMSLKSSGLLVKNHSVHHWINVFKNHLETINEKYAISENEIDDVLQKIKSNQDICSNPVIISKKKQKISKKRKEDKANNNLTPDITNENLAMEELAGDEKRTITYQIAKNKGLTVRRKKELRNPRVHHRVKFKRAKVRRKGQVREAVKEIKRYEGEPTGISTHVIKSVKFK